MVVSENIFVHLCRNGLTTVARHIEETLGTSFAEENRQFSNSSKDRQTVRVFKNIHLRVYISYWRGLLFISCLGVWRYLFDKIESTSFSSKWFTYDAKTKTILIMGFGSDGIAPFLALNMESKTMVQSTLEANVSSFLFVGNHRYAFGSSSAGDGEYKIEINIFTINDKFEIDKKAATTPPGTQQISNLNPQSYDAQADVIYGVIVDMKSVSLSKKPVFVIDAKTLTYKTLNSDNEVGEVVLVQ